MSTLMIWKSLKNCLAKKSFIAFYQENKINDKVYEHVLKAWNKFEMKTRKDYLDLHLKCDVLLLADVFEKFRNSIFKKYGLCLSHHLVHQLYVGTQCIKT